MSGIGTQIGGAAIGLVMAFGVVFPVSLRQTPLDVHSVEVLTPSVPQGGEFRVIIHGNRSEVCNATYYGRILHGPSPSRQILFEDDHRPARGDIGDVDILRSYTIPEGAEVGSARFEMEIGWECSWAYSLFPIVTEIDTIHFTITSREPREPTF